MWNAPVVPYAAVGMLKEKKNFLSLSQNQGQYFLYIYESPDKIRTSISVFPNISSKVHLRTKERV